MSPATANIIIWITKTRKEIEMFSIPLAMTAVRSACCNCDLTLSCLYRVDRGREVLQEGSGHHRRQGGGRIRLGNTSRENMEASFYHKRKT